MWVCVCVFVGEAAVNASEKGYFFEPTIVTNVKEGVKLVDEEQFGPVLPIISYKVWKYTHAHKHTTHTYIHSTLTSRAQHTEGTHTHGHTRARACQQHTHTA